MEFKRGDISISMLITIIILVAGFALLLFVYYQISWTGTIDREVCHRSIIYRGTLPSETKEYVPLTCPTAKICLTGKILGRGDCEEFKNEKGIVTIRVGDGDDGIEDIQRAYAQEILSCWEMVGRGKVSLYSQFLAENYGIGGIAPSCIICSRIAIDKKSFNNINLEKINLHNYMNQHLVPGKQLTYFQYMSGDENAAPIKLEDSINIGKLSVQGDDNKDNNIVLERNSAVISSDSKDFSIDKNSFPETAILFTQVSAPDYKSVFKNDILAIIGGGLTFRAIAPATLGKFAKVVATKPILILTAIIGGYQAGSVAYNRAVTASYCGDMSVGSKAYSGCSVIRTVNYDAENVLKYCTYIESI